MDHISGIGFPVHMPCSVCWPTTSIPLAPARCEGVSENIEGVSEDIAQLRQGAAPLQGARGGPTGDCGSGGQVHRRPGAETFCSGVR